MIDDRPSHAFAAAIARHVVADGSVASIVPRLHLIRSSRPTEPIQALHTPALCLVAQGRKHVMLGREIFHYGRGQLLAVSLDAPVIGQVTEASVTSPYLCLRLDLDLGLLGTTMDESGLDGRSNDPPRSAVTLGEATPEIVEAATRLVRLLDAPRDAAVLARSTEREFLYRVLQSPGSGGLLAILSAGSAMQRVSKAITYLKRTYRQPFSLQAVASATGMSQSSLNQHFKTVTGLSPLQYQKHLRLHEARRLMLNQAGDAAHAGHAVGYESPSQFSRDYRRMFGAPPLQDLTRLRSSWRAEPWLDAAQ
ncbi:AraC family transcriptional regulator [Lichenihabitans psoromatis]|uniref:AraC family transcriptional regulator n=1 Tax=Lichenihabitans psoromatis TaxID=2528642 RepID=UPI001035FCF3|nr:AraC family transcriptional regulator [Lichenihabitans psoromatis]